MLNQVKIKNAPAEVKRASALIFVYAFAVLTTLAISLISEGITDSYQTMRAVSRTVVMSYLAWSLLSLDRRIWWITTILIGVILSIAAFSFSLAIFYGGLETSVLGMIAKAVLPMYLLGHAFLILVRPETRRHFVKVS